VNVDIVVVIVIVVVDVVFVIVIVVVDVVFVDPAVVDVLQTLQLHHWTK